MRLRGWVDEQFSPRIKINAAGGTDLEPVVDTGFSGQLVLPKRYLKKLGFAYRGWRLIELADGSKIPSAFYEGTIYWFGRKQNVWAHPTKSEDALLGTQMLIGYIFDLDIEGNYVAITKKSARGKRQ
jgi:predicted aspartyl protease